MCSSPSTYEKASRYPSNLLKCHRACSVVSDKINRNPSSEHCARCWMHMLVGSVSGAIRLVNQPIKLLICRDFLLHLCTGYAQSSDERKCTTRYTKRSKPSGTNLLSNAESHIWCIWLAEHAMDHRSCWISSAQSAISLLCVCASSEPPLL